MITLHTLPGPATIRIDGAFAPTPEITRAVDATWDEARRAAPWLCDGQVFHLAARHGASLAGFFAPYRYWYAQRLDPALRAQIGLTSLAVTGITRLEDGILLGRRSPRTTQDAGLWELVPAGGIDATDVDGEVDAERALRREMLEELGISADLITVIEPPTLLAHELPADVYDLVLPVRLGAGRAEVEAAFAARRTDETSEVLILRDDEAPAFLADRAADLAPVSRALLEWLLAGC